MVRHAKTKIDWKAIDREITGRLDLNGDRYVTAEVIINTFDLAFAELSNLATGSPAVIRSITTLDHHTYYSWGDACLISLVTTRLPHVEADLPCDP